MRGLRAKQLAGRGMMKEVEYDFKQSGFHIVDGKPVLHYQAFLVPTCGRYRYKQSKKALRLQS